MKSLTVWRIFDVVTPSPSSLNITDPSQVRGVPLTSYLVHRVMVGNRGEPNHTEVQSYKPTYWYKLRLWPAWCPHVQSVQCPQPWLSPVNLREAKNLRNWHTQTISKNVLKVKANFLWLVLNIFVFFFDCNYWRGSALNIMREFKILLWTKFNTPVSKVKSLVTTFSIISLLSLG